jgi:hypothetical protein
MTPELVGTISTPRVQLAPGFKVAGKVLQGALAVTVNWLLAAILLIFKGKIPVLVRVTV